MKKRHIWTIAGLFAITTFGLCVFSATSSPKPMIAYAEETPETEVVKENESEKAVEETTNKFKEIWETYLLPAILSVNLASVIGAATSIFLAVRNHKIHKDYEKKVANIVKIVVEMSGQLLQYAATLAERNSQVKALLDALSKSAELTQQQIALFEEQKKNYNDLKNAVISLVNLEVDLASSSPEFVKSGAAKRAIETKNQLIALIK